MNSFQGVFVATITPKRDGGPHIDIGAALEVVDFLCSKGVKGLALLGSTGEFVHFDMEERLRLHALAIKRSRVPVLVNISHSSLDGAVHLAREAAGAGASGLLLMPPSFFRYGQAEILEYYRQVAGEIGSATPLLLYNIPFFTNELAIESAEQLLGEGVAAGIKDSSGRWEYFERLKALRDRRPFTLFIGNDVIFTRGRSAGAHGVVSGVACAAPELMVALDAAIVSGAGDKVAKLEHRLQEFIAWLDRFPAPMGVREAIAARGLKTGPLAVPLGPEKQRELAEFREWFGGWLKEVLGETAQPR